MSITEQRRAPGATAALAETSATRRASITPIKWWAALGALVLAFEAFVLIRWISGPLFVRVPTGADDPPMYMKVAIVGFSATCIPAALGCLYFSVWRPWRRTGRLSADGILTLSFATLWFGDPLSAYSGHWFTYNSWSVNFGSWVNSIPGALAPAKPGKMLVEPLLIIPGVYVWVFVLTMFLGTWVMRRAEARWPRLGAPALAGLCLLAMYAFDVILEGIVFMPLGVWEYPGGHWNLFPGTYHQYPMTELSTVGLLFTAVACVRYFRAVVPHRRNLWAGRRQPLPGPLRATGSQQQRRSAGADPRTWIRTGIL
jgi:hypothetical protein